MSVASPNPYKIQQTNEGPKRDDKSSTFTIDDGISSSYDFSADEKTSESKKSFRIKAVRADDDDSKIYSAKKKSSKKKMKRGVTWQAKDESVESSKSVAGEAQKTAFKEKLDKFDDVSPSKRGIRIKKSKKPPIHQLGGQTPMVKNKVKFAFQEQSSTSDYSNARIKNYKKTLFSRQATIRETIQDLSPEKFDFVGTLGQGAYGLVHKVCPKGHPSKFYALKELSKAHVMRFGKTASVIREKDILMKLDNTPFFIQFECTFQSEQNLYFLTEYVANGTLIEYIEAWKQVPIDAVRQIAARLVASLEYIHSNNICHRDLKPQNILMNEKYATKICDFGEAKIITGLNPTVINKDFKRLLRERLHDQDDSDDDSDDDESEEDPFEKLFELPKRDDEQRHSEQISPVQSSYGASPNARGGTFVGTALYTAPEMLLNNTSGPFSDLWALGVIIYQMIVGKVPWTGKMSSVIFDQVLNRDMHFPEDTPVDVADLIDQLMQLQPYSRIGAGGEGGDYTALKAHKFFKGIDFNKIQKGKLCSEIPAPPKVSDNISNDPFAEFQVKSFKFEDKNVVNYNTIERQQETQLRPLTFESPKNNSFVISPIIDQEQYSAVMTRKSSIKNPNDLTVITEVRSTFEYQQTINQNSKKSDDQLNWLNVPNLTTESKKESKEDTSDGNVELLDRGITFGEAAQKKVINRKSTSQFMTLKSRCSPMHEKEQMNNVKQAFELAARDEKAKHQKQEACLSQQIELLTLQLAEASERDKTQKRTHQTVIDALHSRLSEKSYETKETEDRDVKLLKKNHKDEILTFQTQVQDLKKQNLLQLHEFKEQQHKLEIQLSTQSQVILDKDTQIFNLQRLVNNQLDQGKIEALQQNFEKQLANKETHYLDNERKLNLNILSYQKDLYDANDKQETQLQVARAKDIKINDFEQQIKNINNKLKSQQNIENGHVEKLKYKESLISKLSSQNEVLKTNQNKRSESLISSCKDKKLQSTSRSHSKGKNQSFAPVYAALAPTPSRRAGTYKYRGDYANTSTRNVNRKSSSGGNSGGDIESTHSIDYKSMGLSHATSGNHINIRMQAFDDQDYEALLKQADNNHEEKVSILSRLVAGLRSKLSKLKVQHNNLKQDSSTQIELLKYENAAFIEKQASQQVQGYEKRQQLINEIEQRDLQLIQLRNQLTGRTHQNRNFFKIQSKSDQNSKSNAKPTSNNQLLPSGDLNDRIQCKNNDSTQLIEHSGRKQLRMETNNSRRRERSQETIIAQKSSPEPHSVSKGAFTTSIDLTSPNKQSFGAYVRQKTTCGKLFQKKTETVRVSLSPKAHNLSSRHHQRNVTSMLQVKTYQTSRQNKYDSYKGIQLSKTFQANSHVNIHQGKQIRTQQNSHLSNKDLPKTIIAMQPIKQYIGKMPAGLSLNSDSKDFNRKKSKNIEQRISRAKINQDKLQVISTDERSYSREMAQDHLRNTQSFQKDSKIVVVTIPFKKSVKTTKNKDGLQHFNFELTNKGEKPTSGRKQNHTINLSSQVHRISNQQPADLSSTGYLDHGRQSLKYASKNVVLEVSPAESRDSNQHSAVSSMGLPRRMTSDKQAQEYADHHMTQDKQLRQDSSQRVKQHVKVQGGIRTNLDEIGYRPMKPINTLDFSSKAQANSGVTAKKQPQPQRSLGHNLTPAWKR